MSQSNRWRRGKGSGGNDGCKNLAHREIKSHKKSVEFFLFNLLSYALWMYG